MERVCFITIGCVYLFSMHCISLHDCWRRPVSLFAQLWFKPCSDSISMFHMPQQDNPAVSHKMAASVIYNNVLELAEEQSTGGNRGSGEPCSQCVSQLEGVLSPHVKRLLAPVTTLQQGTEKGCRKRRQTVLRDTARTGSGRKGIISPSSGTTW